jgi:hypothetical protein
MRETEALSGRRLADAREEGAGVPAREDPQAACLQSSALSWFLARWQPAI